MLYISQLTKRYHQRNVVDHVTFQIQIGKCVALIGPNGSGKSTLIDLIIGDRKPEEGTIEDKSNLLSSEHLGVMFQHTQFPERTTVSELYHLFARCYAQPISLEAFKDMTHFSEEQLRQYAEDLSGGQQRILDFALTLIGQPQLIILDEPTSAMDVEMRQHFWQLIHQLKKEGRTILYTSHYIEEVERMADHVLVLNNGQLVMDDTPQNIKQQQGRSIITLPSQVAETVSHQLPHFHFVTTDDGQLQIETNDIQQTLTELLTHHIPLHHIEVRQHSLLDIVFNQPSTEVK